MKTRLNLLIVLIIGLAACNPAQATVVPTSIPVATEAILQTPTIEATRALSYSPKWYEDPIGKIAFQYPADWSLEPDQVIGDRGSQTLILSQGSSAEKVAPGGARIVLMYISWDPKNDLSARTTQRKTAWEASGFVILDESTRELEDGRAVVDLLMETPDKTQFLVVLTIAGDRYLEMSAEGDLDLCSEILGTLKSIN
jgi:hypothetical protein